MIVWRYLSVMFVPVLFFACSKDAELPEPTVARTVMVYMSANNSLSSQAYNNLNQMEEGAADIEGKLIVYARIFGQQPKIYEIMPDNGPEIKSKVLKTYSDHDASDPAIMKMVFADMKRAAPADSYGVILWSHATNWAPASIYKDISVRSFGDDDYSSMDVQDLKAALPTGLDFLAFDACSMASVEVLYELKDVAPYMLASPTEVLSVGMPYEQINAMLFNPDVKAGLTDVAKTYVAYYQSKTGLEQSATFSVIDTRELENLAQETKNLLTSNPELVRTIKRDGIQQLNLDDNNPIPAFDFGHMLESYIPAEKLTAVEAALNKVVIFKAHTPSFLGHPITTFSGLSSYIPVSEETELATFYKTLGWYSNSGYTSLF